jgi:CDP-glucose 4,6-dehydratase
MENLVNPGPGPSRSFAGTFAGKRVLVTGHTGFKGSWLCEWLLALGADVTGFALPPPTEPALFNQLGLADRINDRRGDIRDLAAVRSAVGAGRPEFVFHLAAQPLVRLSYTQPVETYAINVMGTVNLLEAVRLAGAACTVVVVTTDKCYENPERAHSFREEDPMGGHDPYSSSKGAAELVVSAYRRSYFSAPDSPVRLASARAGNVIGGGDWALDRIVPDCIRSLRRSEVIPVRHPHATRPWQHVLEPLSGYLLLASAIARRVDGQSLASSRGPNLYAQPELAELCAAFNFGPAPASNRTVAELVGEVLQHWPGRWEDRSDPHAVHEAALLALATDKALRLLDWKPAWDFAAAIKATVEWYRLVSSETTTAAVQTRRQIAGYAADARTLNLAWAHE